MWFPAGFCMSLLVQRTAKEVLLRRCHERHTSCVQRLQNKLLRKVIWRVVQCVFTLVADGACLYLLTHLGWEGWVGLYSGAGMTLEFSPNTKTDKASYQWDLWACVGCGHSLSRAANPCCLLALLHLLVLPRLLKCTIPLFYKKRRESSSTNIRRAPLWLPFQEKMCIYCGHCHKFLSRFALRTWL